ncbi:GNAT family N-acetyltransferase [Tropicimonas isoalkanivorans]|uniref:L-ornithine N(alpha)-acyltransferase n=1 Tax=Tropicimonas isoalkanivorans TaxID=441112 RepID=A0A1I1IFV9_9RHOB|nr:GNAT family N-acetyltransferase [Tropicimonas isoalkanivorans]SFC34562.1 ornithine-acyl[acyl carrier protein] N-acyltransferase [Tropicimonas isoalkanivorans]
MPRLVRGRYIARPAETPADLAAALTLRAASFRDGQTEDADAFDAVCDHVLVEDRQTGMAVCTFRLLSLGSGREIGRTYAAKFYDLSGLASFDGPMVEMGRFCIRPGRRDADILRLAWGAIARVVDGMGVHMLFGCTSFQGIAPGPYTDAFALLGQRHLGPAKWRPQEKAAEVVRLARTPHHPPDAKLATKTVPPLLRSYLAMGGWVGDHVVIDRDLGTLHVFTALEVRAIPPARKRLLRRVAYGSEPGVS